MAGVVEAEAVNGRELMKMMTKARRIFVWLDRIFIQSVPSHGCRISPEWVIRKGSPVLAEFRKEQDFYFVHVLAAKMEAARLECESGRSSRGYSRNSSNVEEARCNLRLSWIMFVMEA